MSFLQILGYIFVGIAFLSLFSHLVVTYRESRRWKAVLNAWKQETFTPDEVRKDIEHFEDLYTRVHPDPYHALPQADFKRLFADLKAEADRDLTRPEVYCLLAETVSRFNDEHTQVIMPSVELNQLLGEEGKVFPYDVQFFGERCYIRSPRGEEQSLPIGTEILSINKVPAGEIIQRLTPLFWGTRDRQRAVYAQRYFVELLYLVYGFEDGFDVVVRTPSGHQHDRRLKGMEYKVNSPPDFSYKILGETLLFDYRQFEDPERKFKQFLEGMFNEAREKEIKSLVIDLRGNQGGTSSLGDDLLRYLTNQSVSQFDRVEIRSSPEVKRFFLSFLPPFLHWFFPLPYLHPMLRTLWRTKTGRLAVLNFEPISPATGLTPFEGEIYVLIDAGTMSSSSMLAATVKTHGIGKLVGEETGGFPTNYGNMLDLHLPKTGLKVMIPSSINHGNGTGPVVPDIPVMQTVEDFIAGKDTALESIIQR